jgi:hypothetical protein
LVILNWVPKGRLGWAAVKRDASKTSPEAVRCPLNSVPYHEAIPSCRKKSFPVFWVWAAPRAAKLRLVTIMVIILFIITVSAGKGKILRGRRTSRFLTALFKILV